MFRIFLVFMIFAIMEYSHGIIYGHWGRGDWGHNDWGQSDWGQGDWGQGDWSQSDWGPGDWSYGKNNRHGYQKTLNEIITNIGQKYSFAEFSLGKFCKENAVITPKIMYGYDAYNIQYSLPDITNLHVKVEIQNGLIITNVDGKEFINGFKDVRILPEILDVNEGRWFIENTDLRITFPYKVPIGQEFIAECPSEKAIVSISEGDEY